MTTDIWNTFYRIIGGEPHLKTLRPVVTHIYDLVERPTTSSKELARFIMMDPALSTRVLTVVNSPAFGLRHQVTDLAFAISLLGYNQIRDILLTIALIEKVGKKQEARLVRLWKHSYYCGKVAELLAANLGRFPGEAFAAGLLHDIGKILLCYSNERAFTQALHNYTFSQGKLFHWQAERQSLGLSHAELGSLAASYWQLPEHFAAILWNHHLPAELLPGSPEGFLTRVVHVADIVCWRLGFPSVNSVNPYTSKDLQETLDKTVLAELGVTEEILEDSLSKSRKLLLKGESLFEWLEEAPPPDSVVP